jgi:hypothetical protein
VIACDRATAFSLNFGQSRLERRDAMLRPGCARCRRREIALTPGQGSS